MNKHKSPVAPNTPTRQSLPADAVTSSWNVTLDDNGNISSAP